MGVALGLTAALCWGLADYVAAQASRRAGTLRVVLGFHLVATVLLAVLVVATGALDEASSSDLPLFAVVGLLGWGSYLCFYRALAIGPISIVSPIVSGYAAVTVVLAVIVLDERLPRGSWAAIALSLLGVVLASTDVGAIRRAGHVHALGLALGLAAMILIGAFVFGVAYKANDLGWLAPVFLARGFTALLVLVQALAVGQWRFPDRSPLLLGAICLLALLDTGGYVALNVGARVTDTAVVAAASAPYAVVPIVMGVLLLRERPTPTQWVGVGAVLAGLVLLAVSS